MTNPERFLPVHGYVTDLMSRLEAAYDIERVEDRHAADRDASSIPESLFTVQLLPCAELAAPVEIDFTTFPGLDVRFGRWSREPFPTCGCDACDEDADSVIESFTLLMKSIVLGHFEEDLSVPRPVGSAWLTTEFGSPVIGAVRGSRRRLTRAEARTMLAGGLTHCNWKPWPRRSSTIGLADVFG